VVEVLDVVVAGFEVVEEDFVDVKSVVGGFVVDVEEVALIEEEAVEDAGRHWPVYVKEQPLCRKKRRHDILYQAFE
jgi:hypothetical protein